MTPTLALLDFLGGPELVLILVVVLIFFGDRKKLPEFTRGLGRTVREVKRVASDVEQEFKRVIEEADVPRTLDQLTEPPPESRDKTPPTD